MSADGVSWFLLGASPDLRSQIEACQELHPHVAPRHSPICGVVLINAELDQSLGLLLLREFQPLNIYATGSVSRILREQNSMFFMLNREPGSVCWHTIRVGENFQLRTPTGIETKIECSPVSVSTRYPAYVGNANAFSPDEAVLGLRVTAGGKALAYFPSCGSVTESILEKLDGVDLMLFDGTFFADDELGQVLVSGPTSAEVGHLPVGGAGGSLRRLSDIPAKRKLYIHINNTNPMLNESSEENRAVRDAGWDLAEDGWQTVL